MNLKNVTTERNRKGSYLVEASLTLPVFILSAAALAMVIHLIAVCETIGYVMSREIKENLLLDAGILNHVSLCRTIEDGVISQHTNVSDFQVKRVRQKVQNGTMTDLITVSAEARFHVILPLNIGGRMQFQQKLMARAFTGTRQDELPLGEAEFMQGGNAAEVMIYPKYGERFHMESCSIVQNQMKSGNPGWCMDRKEAELWEYTPCEICGGGTGAWNVQ